MGKRVTQILSTHTNPLEVGGKGRGLQLAMKLGLVIPPTLVIPNMLDPSLRLIARDLAQESADVAAWADRHQFKHLVLRSSAHEEDSAERSFAGVFESRFTPASADSIQTALRRVALSGGTERARAYRDSHGITRGSQMSVLVQPTLPAIRGGVLAAGQGVDRREFVVQGSWGLPLAIVSGVIEGDIFDSRIKSSAATRYTRGSKRFRG